MKIETKVTLEDNVRAVFFFKYTYPATIFFTVLAVLFLILFSILYFNGASFPDKIGMYFALFLIIYLLLTPVLLYIQTKKQYESNKNLHQPITYEFTDASIEIKGEKIYSTLSWESVYQVRESGSAFFIYQNRGIANVLPKRCFSAEQLAEFRAMVKRTGVKSRLRKQKK